MSAVTSGARVSDSEIAELLRALTRIEQRQHEHGERLEAIERQLRALNGQVARHGQDLYGSDGQSGLRADVRRLWERMETALRHAHQTEAVTGMVPARTMWSAIAAIAGVAAVIVALIVGIG